MRKLLMATSALLLLGAVPGFAQEADPGTGQFEPANQGDEPTPDFVDPADMQEGDYRVWRPLAQGETMQSGDCVQPGTGQFDPSNLSDEPTPDFVQCPEGMMPADNFMTGAVE